MCASVQHLVCIIYKVAPLGGVEHQNRLHSPLSFRHMYKDWFAFNKHRSFKQNLSRLTRNYSFKLTTSRSQIFIRFVLFVGLWKMHIAKLRNDMFGGAIFLVGIRGVTLYLPSCGLLSLQFIFTHFLYLYRHNETLPCSLCYSIIRKIHCGYGIFTDTHVAQQVFCSSRGWYKCCYTSTARPSQMYLTVTEN